LNRWLIAGPLLDGLFDAGDGTFQGFQGMRFGTVLRVSHREQRVAMDYDRFGPGDFHVRLPTGHDRRAVAEMRRG